MSTRELERRLRVIEGGRRAAENMPRVSSVPYGEIEPEDWRPLTEEEWVAKYADLRGGEVRN